jgi:hypothetical protein
VKGRRMPLSEAHVPRVFLPTLPESVGSINYTGANLSRALLLEAQPKTCWVMGAALHFPLWALV